MTPSLPPPITFQARPSSFVLYTLTLAAFKVYGVSTFAAGCLHRAYHSNPHVYGLLAQGVSDELQDVPEGVDLFHGDAYIYLRFKRLWNSPEIHESLNVSREEIKKRTSDAGQCGKVEGTVGEWKTCGGCSARWYCGASCQKADWRRGGHKIFCEDLRQIPLILNGLINQRSRK